ncbi:MAG: DEAD/DEAH box helicase [Streptosporangiaceae bacterium]
MPHSARGRRTPSRSGSRETQQQRHGHAAGKRPPTRPDGPHSGLDQALAAAAAAPQPTGVTFSALGVDARLVSALAAHGIQEPFAIQARVLPDALAGRSVLGRAQTGSGKTLAFGLPILTRLAATPSPRQQKEPRALVLVPTRELARQVAGVLAPLGRRVGVSTATVYGGVPIGRQIDSVRDADIVVATPGRLIDLMERRACKLSGIEITVLDEADHMADLGFMPAVTRILDDTPPGGQRMFFSATLDRGVGQLVTSYVSDPALHAVPATVDCGPAEHSVLVLSAQDKVPVAAEIASRQGRTLIFVRTKHGADRLAKQLVRAGVSAGAIHGDRNQSQRQRALDAFAAGHPRVLVATDVAARGIHVDDVDLVVQYDPPADSKDYLHRSGRTARAGASGMVVALAERGQVRDLQRLQDAAGITAAHHEVAAGHHVVRQIAASGTPIPAAAGTPESQMSRPDARRTGNPTAGRTPRRRSGTGGAGPIRPAVSGHGRPVTTGAPASPRKRRKRAGALSRGSD